MNLTGMDVVENVFLKPGTAVRLGYTLHVRHLHEFFLWWGKVTWHPERSTCPTWTEAGECSCMVEGGR